MSKSNINIFICNSIIWKDQSNVDKFNFFHTFDSRRILDNIEIESILYGKNNLYHFISNGYPLICTNNFLKDLDNYYTKYNKISYHTKKINSFNYNHNNNNLINTTNNDNIKYKKNLPISYQYYLNHIKILLGIYNETLYYELYNLTKQPIKLELIEDENYYTYDLFFLFHMLVDINYYKLLYSSFYNYDNINYNNILIEQDIKLNKYNDYYNDQYFKYNFNTFYDLEEKMNDFVNINIEKNLNNVNYLEDLPRNKTRTSIVNISIPQSLYKNIYSIPSTLTSTYSSYFSKTKTQYEPVFNFQYDFPIYLYSYFPPHQIKYRKIFNPSDNIFYLAFSSYLLNSTNIYFILHYLDLSLVRVNDESTIYDNLFLYNCFIGKILPQLHYHSLLSYNLMNYSCLSSNIKNLIYKLSLNCNLFRNNETDISPSIYSSNNFIENYLNEDNLLLLLNYMNKNLLSYSFISFYEDKNEKSSNNYFIDNKFLDYTFNYSLEYRYKHYSKILTKKFFFEKGILTGLIDNENSLSSFFSKKGSSLLIRETIDKFKYNKEINSKKLLNYDEFYYNRNNFFYSNKNLIRILLQNNYFNIFHLFFILNYVKKKFFFYKEFNNIYYYGIPTERLNVSYALDQENYLNCFYKKPTCLYRSYYRYYFLNFYRDYVYKSTSCNSCSISSLSSHSLINSFSKNQDINNGNSKYKSLDILGFGSRNTKHILLFDSLFINRNILSLEILVYFSFFFAHNYNKIDVSSNSFSLCYRDNTNSQLNFYHLCMIFRNEKFSLNIFTYLLFFASRKKLNFNEFVLDSSSNLDSFRSLPSNSKNLITTEKKFSSQLSSNKKQVQTNLINLFDAQDIYKFTLPIYLMKSKKLTYKILLLFILILKKMKKFSSLFNHVFLLGNLNDRNEHLNSLPYNNFRDYDQDNMRRLIWISPNISLIWDSIYHSFTLYTILFRNSSFFSCLYNQKKIIDFSSLSTSFFNPFISQLFCDDEDEKLENDFSKSNINFFYINDVNDSLDNFLTKFLYDKKKYHPFYQDSDSEYEEDSNNDTYEEEYSEKKKVTEQFEIKKQLEDISQVEINENEINKRSSSNIITEKEKKLTKLLNLVYKNKKKFKKHTEIDNQGDFEDDLEGDSFSFYSFKNYLFDERKKYIYSSNIFSSSSSQSPSHFGQNEIILQISILSPSHSIPLTSKLFYSQNYIEELKQRHFNEDTDWESIDYDNLFTISMNKPKESKERLEDLIDQLLDIYFDTFNEEDFFNTFKENIQKDFFDEIYKEIDECVNSNSFEPSYHSPTSYFPEKIYIQNINLTPPHYSNKLTQIFETASLKIDEKKKKYLNFYHSNLHFILTQVLEENGKNISSPSSLSYLFRSTSIDENIFFYLLPFLTSNDYVQNLPQVFKDSSSKLLYTSDEFFLSLEQLIMQKRLNKNEKNIYAKVENYYSSLNIIEQYKLVSNLIKSNKIISTKIFYNLIYLHITTVSHSPSLSSSYTPSSKNFHLKSILKLFFIINYDKSPQNIFLSLLKDIFYNIATSKYSSSPRCQLSYYNNLLLIYYYYLIFYKFFHANRDKLLFFFQNSTTNHSNYLWKELLFFNNYKNLLEKDHFKAFLNLLNNLIKNYF